METFIGKFLVRRVKMTNGQDAFIFCGTALPENFPITDISDSDEVWCAELMVMDVKKFVQHRGSTGFHGSPEDFLAMPTKLTGDFSEWTPKNRD